jgi:hypothetical protein
MLKDAGGASEHTELSDENAGQGKRFPESFLAQVVGPGTRSCGVVILFP